LFLLDHQINAIVIRMFSEVLVSSKFCALLKCRASRLCFTSRAGLLREGEVIERFTVVMSVSDRSIE